MRIRPLLITALLLGHSPSNATAQKKVEYVHGGVILWISLEEVTPNGHSIVTAEDGLRIRELAVSAGNPDDVFFHFNAATDVSASEILRDIRVHGGVAIAVGSNAAWAREGHPNSWNFGKASFVAPLAQGLDLYGVHIGTTVEDFWAVGEDGLIGHTTSPLGSGVQQFQFPVAGQDPRGQGMDVLSLAVEEGPGFRLGAAGTTGGRFYFTHDGVDWFESTVVWDQTPSCGSLGSRDIWTIEWVPGQTGPVTSRVGYAGGGGPAGTCGLLFRTKDGGQTWIEESRSFSSEDTACPPLNGTCNGTVSHGLQGLGAQYATVYRMHAFDNGRVLATSYGGGILRRELDGKWLDKTDNCNFFSTALWAVGGDDDQLAYIGGHFGSFRRTTDQGDTWMLVDPQHYQTLGRLKAICFLSDGAGGFDYGYEVGQQLRTDRTQDGGSTWTMLSRYVSGPNKSQILNAVDFRDDGDGLPTNDVGVAVGTKGFIFSTLDGGTTCWTEMQLAGDPEMLGVAYAGGSTGAYHFWAVGALDTVVRSTDSGASWAVHGPAGISPTAKWRGVDFANVNAGAIVGMDGPAGLAYSVTNAATTPVWTSITNPANPPNALHDTATNGLQMVAVGDDEILRYQGGMLVPMPNAPSGKFRSVAIAGDGVDYEVMVGGFEERDGRKFGVLHHYSSVWDTWSEVDTFSTGEVIDIEMFRRPMAGGGYEESEGYFLTRGTTLETASVPTLMRFSPN